jgi:periplasmic copper chaperone A
MKRYLLSAVCFALMAGSASAHDYVTGTLQVDHPWTKPTSATATMGQGYMVVRNKGTEVEKLMAATSELADRVEIHETARDGGVTRMRSVMGVEINSGGTLELKPGGYHVMFIGLKRQIKDGEKFKATLEFEKAGKVDVEFETQPSHMNVAAHATIRPGGELTTATIAKPKRAKKRAVPASEHVH